MLPRTAYVVIADNLGGVIGILDPPFTLKTHHFRLSVDTGLRQLGIRIDNSRSPHVVNAHTVGKTPTQSLASHITIALRIN